MPINWWSLRYCDRLFSERQFEGYSQYSRTTKP